MSQGRRMQYPKLDLNINQMPYKISAAIENTLDIGIPKNLWRTFITRVEDTIFQFNVNEIQKIEHEGQKVGGSASHVMFNYLSCRAFTIGNLLSVLDKMKLEEHVENIRDFADVPPEPVTITKQPETPNSMQIGSHLKLKVKARGFPYPRYQWFKGEDLISDATGPELSIPNIKLEDQGNYCCRLHNSSDSRYVVFTNTIFVEVLFIKINQSSPSQIILCGDKLSLWCNAYSNSPNSQLLYQWYKDGNLVGQSPQFHKEQSAFFDSGQYKCVVCNLHGMVSTEIIHINVEQSSLEIVTHPQFTMVTIGGVALLRCVALGPKPIKYQWYKDWNIIPNATDTELKIPVETQNNGGVYFCYVTCPIPNMVCQSDFAILKVTNSIPEDLNRKKYTATDKVALLIGNEDYRSENKLKATLRDVELLSKIFSQLKFKVVSLINLTLVEMKSAVGQFLELLDTGVYGVFYYAGHGFEIDGDPYSYLMPVDAPTGCDTATCLPAEKVHQLMVAKKPALCCLILDICRTISRVNQKYKSEIIEPDHNTNSVFLYATSRGLSAYENNVEKIGRFVKYLEKFLLLDEGIESMFGKVREGISRLKEESSLDKDAIQVPELRTNLAEVGRSLADKIHYTNHTQEYNRRYFLWKSGYKLPHPMTIFKELLGVQLKVEFKAQFSNVMAVTVTVEESGNTSKCYAWVASYPSVLTADKPKILQPDKKKTLIVIRDLQKLQDPMKIIIKLVYHDTRGTQQSLEVPVELDFHWWLT